VPATAAERVFRLAVDASEEDWAAGLYWYATAHSAAASMADRYGVSVECAAGVIAALSPQVAWDVNLWAAERLFATGTTSRVLPVSRDRARQVADGADPDAVVRGPKCRAFYSNILNPGASDAVTVDRHAVDAAVGTTTDRERKRIVERAGGYETVADAYRAAADRLGILPCQCQAVVWCFWRRTKGGR
jgi:hypothetical protein